MTSAPIKLKRFTSFSDARSAVSALAEAPQPSPFDRLDWFEALHASAFPSTRPLIVMAMQRNACCWLVLVENGDDGLVSLSNWYSFFYRPQFASAPDKAQRTRLLTAIARDLRQDFSSVVFHPVIDYGDNAVGMFTRAMRLAGWSVIPRIVGYKRFIELPENATFAQYWAERPGPLRSTFARKSQRYPLSTIIHDRVDDEIWGALRAIFKASWKPKGDDFDFLRRFAEREAQAGRLLIGFACQDERPVAVELWTVEHGIAYIHKLAFDEKAAEASPGTQLSHAMFAHAIDTLGVRAIDFGTGDNGYKANWIPTLRPVLELDAFDLRRPETWRSALTAGLSALRPARSKSTAQGRNPRREALSRMNGQKKE